jgi:hypothetical protein
MPEPMADFRAFYPPRTKQNIDPLVGVAWDMWAGFEDAVAQFKLKGTRNMTVIRPSGAYEMWGRGGGKKGLPQIQLQYALTPKMRAELESYGLSKGKLHVIDGELMHAKTKNIKDSLYQFDILVHDGMYLLGLPYAERYALLRSIMGGERLLPEAFQMEEGRSYLATNYQPDRWKWMWEQAQPYDPCEGMVLKRMGFVSALKPGGNEVNNDGWMCRVRKPTKNYRN